MSIYFITNNQADEPDILCDRQHLVLHIRSLDGAPMLDIPAPAGGWTHERLTAVEFDVDMSAGANAYLGTSWVGSTEC